MTGFGHSPTGDRRANARVIEDRVGFGFGRKALMLARTAIVCALATPGGLA